MKLAKFTNYAEGLRGNPLYINTEHVSAIYERPNPTGGTVVTALYTAVSGIEWTVEESLSEAIKIMEEARNA